MGRSRLNIAGGFDAEPVRPSTRMTTSNKAPQAKLKGPDKWGVTVWRCSRHDIDYRIKRAGGNGVCPLCEEQARTEKLREEMKKLSNANDVLKRDLGRVRAQLEYLDGMREAASELDDDDLMFLKEMLYRYKAKPDRVRVSQAVTRKKIKTPNGTAHRDDVVGWRVTYADVDPAEQREHVAKSVGGRMMALQFSEALKVTGLKGAMQNLNKALHQSMANADAT